jgi:hypothetical protein
MLDKKTYDGVVKLFLGGKWGDASCAMSVHEDGIFISVYPGNFKGIPLTMRFDVDLLIKIADWLREEDEEIEGFDDEMDIDDLIFGRLAVLEERVAKLEAKPVINGRRSGGFYGTEFPQDFAIKLVNSEF